MSETTSGATMSRRSRVGVPQGTTTGGTTRRAAEAVPRAVTTSGAVDAGVLVLLLGAVVVGFAPVWGSTGYLRPTVGGAVVGLAVAWLGAWRRWRVLSVTAAAVVGYLALGGAFALPSTAVAGVAPTLGTVRGLALGAVHGWKEFVTTVPPMHAFDDQGVVPFLVLYLTALLAGTVAWRARYAAWALAPVAAGLAASILLGTVEASMPVVQGLVVGVVGLLWGALRVIENRVGRHTVETASSREASRRLRWYRFRTGAAILGLGAVAAAFAGPALAPADPRTVVRDVVVPPLDLHEFVSPLASFRKLAKDQREDDLFTITGLPEHARVRLATLDTYDGVVFDASSDQPGSGVYTRAGSQIATADTTPSRSLRVEVGAYSGVWMPDAGSLTGITWTGPRAQELADGTYYNGTTRTALSTAGLGQGDAYAVEAQVTAEPSEQELATGRIATDVEQPPVPDELAPAQAASKAAQFMGEETDPVKRLFALRDGLVASGIFSSGLDGQLPSRPGHSADRIDTLLGADEMVGDDEQFAVALALMARDAGIPARVVMGFYADPAKDERKDGQPWTVTGADVHAWVEVPFDGYGWVAVDAVPDPDNKIQPEPKSEQVPKPPVLQDPEPPEEPADDVPGDVKDDKDDHQDSHDFAWGTAVLVAVSVLLPLAILAAPVLLVLTFKSRRRTRRRTTGPFADRVSGGWREVVDTATDLGATLPSGATRRETAGTLVAVLGDHGHVPLAHRADATVFGVVEPTHDEAEAYWREVEAVLGRMRGSVDRRAQLRAALSLRSVRESGYLRLPGARRLGAQARGLADRLPWRHGADASAEAAAWYRGRAATTSKDTRKRNAR
ncbi:transglutaminase-like domain-containing protein [Xylanimonas sp. McL0601]|uniref:transglutaminase-like domain-containing protein n=1 Tax=Xylanimonas sp. McL0601 TaxID=3414739 RepID=UPI003CEAA010